MAKITNEMRYKTAEERANAFHEWCGDRRCDSCVFSEMCGGCDERTVGIDVMAHWLALEADEEKPENCPFCGVHSRICNTNGEMFFVECSNGKCGYRSANETTKESAIAAHNRVARAVRAEKSNENK